MHAIQSFLIKPVTHYHRLDGEGYVPSEKTLSFPSSSAIVLAPIIETIILKQLSEKTKSAFLKVFLLSLFDFALTCYYIVTFVHIALIIPRSLFILMLMFGAYHGYCCFYTIILLKVISCFQFSRIRMIVLFVCRVCSCAK